MSSHQADYVFVFTVVSSRLQATSAIPYQPLRFEAMATDILQ